ncbi:GGDEF domain-containing protein [Thermotoga sp. KOL6]|uniref:GGDEF domain-containing protein n=1 Tax=Thermotoga sp. KOL6 TaxID=126741 RepID=UPI000C7898EA|nr:GGDEF domain-containing protein [Thermotoga sp. KOL6]PLV60385.1 diguanylate cyclase [Thermotoga sp. KOL6]
MGYYRNTRYKLIRRISKFLSDIVGVVVLIGKDGNFVVDFSDGNIPPFFKEGVSYTSNEIKDILKLQRKRVAEIFAVKDAAHDELFILYLKKDLEKETLHLIQSLMFSESEDSSLEYIAYHDPLTGLPNRRYFHELGNRYLAIAKRENKSLYVLFMDLSGFKKINDTYGHMFGDEVLKTVAKRVLDRIRRSDIVSRIGGDEFAILLYDMKESYLESFLKRLFSAFDESIEIENTKAFVSANVGISRFPEDGGTLEELLKIADERMYAAKTQGKPFILPFSRVS